MIHIGNKEMTAVYIGQKAVAAIYAGGKLVWQAVRSCFGSGFWRGDKPWSRTDGWRRNK